MDFFDVTGLLASSKRLRTLMMIALIVGMVGWRTETVNLLVGQAQQKYFAVANPLLEAVGMRCATSSDGWFEPTVLDCAAIPTTTASTTTTTVAVTTGP